MTDLQPVSESPTSPATGLRDRVAADRLAMTFDDGPDPEWTPAVLDALRRAGARATFFVRTPRHPDLVRRIVADGHECAYHCDRHVRHSERTPESLSAEVERGVEWLDRIVGPPRCWRPPWGLMTTATAEIAVRLELELWGWSDDPEDWSGRRAEAMLGGLKRAIRPGAVVLLHDGIGPGARRRDCAETARLVEPLAALARERGLDPREIGVTAARSEPEPVR